MKKIIINNSEYYYDRKTNTLYYDEDKREQCPVAVFNNSEYASFLRQLSEEVITKKQMKSKSVVDCLRLIYNNQVKETALHELPKEKLADFILELFNKKQLPENIYR